MDLCSILGPSKQQMHIARNYAFVTYFSSFHFEVPQEIKMTACENQWLSVLQWSKTSWSRNQKKDVFCLLMLPVDPKITHPLIIELSSLFEESNYELYSCHESFIAACEESDVPQILKARYNMLQDFTVWKKTCVNFQLQDKWPLFQKVLDLQT